MSAPLRINFFVQGVQEQGTYFRFQNLAIALEQLGHKVTIFGCDNDTNSKPRSECRNGINYFIIPSSKGTSFLFPAAHPLNAARRWFSSYPSCDVAHLFQPFLSAYSAWIKCRAKSKFYDWDDLWVGGLIRDPLTSWKDRWTKISAGFLERSLPSRANHVTTCSQFLADLALKRGAHKASVIHNGIWSFKPLKKNEARSRLRLNSGALYVGFMGRTCDELAWCFDAVASNMDIVPQLRLALCGMSGEFLQTLKPKLRDRVDHLGQLTPDATRDFAAALDLGLLPLADTPFNQSRFPIKFAEYMAAGIPVLCSTVGECSKFFNVLPCAIPAGMQKSEWLIAFRNIIQMALKGNLPKVDLSLVNETLSWKQHAISLENLYHQTNVI